MTRIIFVFGSNLRGAHGAGAAFYAHRNHGAVLGQGIGLQGDSYGIPTKDMKIKTLPLDAIRPYVDQFKAFAAEHPELLFQVTAIGCGLAGYTPKDIAPMFKGVTDNCMLPEEFKEYA